jgi:hypothetical protein
VQMVVQNGKSTDSHGEDLGQFVEPIFDPEPSIKGAFPEQKGAADAAAGTVIPTSDVYVDKSSASGGHGVSPEVTYIVYLTTDTVSIFGACKCFL